MVFSFSWFSSFLKKDLELNDTSFESPKIELLELAMKLGVAWPKGPETFITDTAGYPFENSLPYLVLLGAWLGAIHTKKME